MTEDNGQPANTADMAGLYLKMSRVMGHLERLPKRGVNKHFNYEYVTDSDVLDAVRQAMSKESVAFFVDIAELAREGKFTLAHLDITFCDGETGAYKTIHWVGEALDTQDKGINKAVTAGVKYCLLKTFLMSAGEDDDPDGGKPTRATAKRAPQPKPASKSSAAKGERKGWPSAIVSAIVDAHLAANTPNTTGMLNLSKAITPADSKERIMTWATFYRSARGEMESKDAAATADTALIESEKESAARGPNAEDVDA